MTREITQEYLNELFEYDGKHLMWKVSRSNIVKIGAQAGTSLNGYIHITIDGKQYYEHVLIWVLVYGKIPDNNIDHINRIKDDNRICNLRDVTQSQNLYNQKGRENNSESGIRGVYRNGKGWRAMIYVNGKNKHLGTFKTKEEAQARWIEEVEKVNCQFIQTY